MTSKRRFKKLIRARIAKTGESYTTAYQIFRNRNAESETMSDTTNETERTYANEQALAALREAGFAADVQSITRLPVQQSNDNYIVDYAGGKAVLRVWKWSSASQAASELLVLHRLAESGFPGPKPILPAPGSPPFAINEHPAALFEFIDGKPGRNTLPETLSDVDIAFAGQMGELIASVHVGLDGVKELECREQPYSMRLIERLEKARAIPAEPELMAEVNSRLDSLVAAEQQLAELSRSEQIPVGVIHDEPGPWNVLVRDSRIVALMDFENIHLDLLVYDIAHVASQWASYAVIEEPGFTPPEEVPFFGLDGVAVQAIVKGYDSVRPLTVGERRALALAVPVRLAMSDVLIPLPDIFGMPDWNFADYLKRFDVLELCDNADWLALFE